MSLALHSFAICAVMGSLVSMGWMLNATFIQHCKQLSQIYGVPVVALAATVAVLLVYGMPLGVLVMLVKDIR